MYLVPDWPNGSLLACCWAGFRLTSLIEALGTSIEGRCEDGASPQYCPLTVMMSPMNTLDGYTRLTLCRRDGHREKDLTHHGGASGKRGGGRGKDWGVRNGRGEGR